MFFQIKMTHGKSPHHTHTRKNYVKIAVGQWTSTFSQVTHNPTGQIPKEPLKLLCTKLKSFFLPPSLTDDEDEEDCSCHKAEVLGCTSKLLSHIGCAIWVVIQVAANAISPSLLIYFRWQLHLHLTVVTLHILGQVESCVGVGLPIKLSQIEKG